MKKYIILALALVLLSSCGSSKQTIKENLTAQTDSVYLHHDSTAVQVVSKKVEAETGTEEVETTTTIYDTKTTDKDGTHPVFSRTTSTSKKGIKKNKEETTSQAKQTVNKDSANVNKKSDHNKEANKANTETTVPKQISHLVWSIIVLIAILAIIFIGWKFREKIKLLFPKK
jgi:hypothetical protein